MNSPPSRNELVLACRLLFGVMNEDVSGFLDSLDIKDAKRIFRKRLMECHPDRAQIVGTDEKVLTERFKRLQAAFDMILCYLESRPAAAAGRPSPTSSPYVAPWTPPRATYAPPRPQVDASAKDHFWSGPIPRKALLFGQFLFFCGRISSVTLLRAISWQRMQRPIFGKIGRAWGLLTEGQIARALQSRPQDLKIGESCLRFGFIRDIERETILRFQREQQPRIGRFFLNVGAITTGDLEDLFRLHLEHNFNLDPIQ